MLKLAYVQNLVARKYLKPPMHWGDEGEGLVSPGKMFRKTLEKTKHTYFFIMTINQEQEWNKFLEEGNLEDFLVFKHEKYILNPAHPGDVPRLKVYIFQGKGTEE